MQLAEVPRSASLFWFVGALLAGALGVAGARRAAVTAPGEEPALAAAVLDGGFAVMEGGPNDRHVITVDRDGGKQERLALPVVAPKARMVGAARGVLIGWVFGDKVHLARLKGDGELGKAKEWGKRVAMLCDGVATSDHAWGIGWLEKDGRVWVVHGPTRGGRTIDGEVLAFADVATTTTRNTWCGVTSTGRGTALMWRDGASRYWLNTCDSNGCSDKVLRLPISNKLALEAIACNKTACLIAGHDGGGGYRAVWWKLDGKVAWSKPLADAAEDTSFTVTGAGDAAFAIGYVTREGAVVSRAISSGSIERAWADPYSKEVPAIAWAGDKLFVAHRHQSGVSPEVVPLPR